MGVLYLIYRTAGRGILGQVHLGESAKKAAKSLTTRPIKEINDVLTHS
jgi:hypothetical protein